MNMLHAHHDGLNLYFGVVCDVSVIVYVQYFFPNFCFVAEKLQKEVERSCRYELATNADEPH